MKDNEVIFVKRVPPNLKKRFKIYCAEHEVTMTDKIIELITKAIKWEKTENGSSGKGH